MAQVTVSSDAQITELAVNDHACLTFGEPDELIDLTAAFVRDGLDGGLKVIWLSDSGPRQVITELARRGIAVEAALAVGQMTALACENYLLSGQSFAAGHAMSWLNEQMAASRNEGFSGLRVALDMSWALRPIAGVEQLPDFEENVGKVLTDHDGFRPVPVRPRAVRPGHACLGGHAAQQVGGGGHLLRETPCCGSAASTPRQVSGWQARSTSTPKSRSPWPWPRRSGLDGDITVTMAALSFIDVPCMRMIVNLAKSIPAPRKVILQCQPRRREPVRDLRRRARSAASAWKSSMTGDAQERPRQDRSNPAAAPDAVRPDAGPPDGVPPDDVPPDEPAEHDRADPGPAGGRRLALSAPRFGSGARRPGRAIPAQGRRPGHRRA